jgi:hypothetical protein
MYKKESEKKDFERKILSNKLRVLNIVIVEENYKKRGKFNIKTRQGALKVEDSDS